MIRSKLFHLSVPLGLLALAACSDSPAGPGAPVLSQEITLGRLGQAIDSAPQRVEIKLVTGSLVAAEVELKTPDELTDEESIRGAVSAVSAGGGSGTLTLDIGGLQVDFAATARLRGADGGDLSFDEFVARIEAALAAGQPPFVRAKRPAPSEPQGPDDGTFQATEIRLLDGLESPKLELNVDTDNFATNDTPPPDAYLHVLGLTIEIRAQSGSTDLQEDQDDRNETEVRGMVASVDQGAGQATLVDGTVITIVAETRIGGGNDAEHLGSLAAVAQALAAGDSVKADAEGVVDGTNPLTLIAREAEFERADANDDGNGNDPGDAMEYQQQVTSASVAERTFTLSDGTVVKLTDATVVDSRGDLLTLQAVADALQAGTTVRAEGHAVVESAGPPAVVVAATVKWETGG